MTNPNLVARHIIDKNGRHTTVHVSMGKLSGNENTAGDSVFAHDVPPRMANPAGVYNFSVPISRVVRNEYLPRKRNPRDVHYIDHVLIDVPSVTEEDAPVNFVVNGEEVRAFDDILYRKLVKDDGTPFEAEDYFLNTPSLGSSYSRDDRPDYNAIYNDNADQYLVVDGEVWRKSLEPMYVLERRHYIDRDTMDVKISFGADRERNEDVFSALERDLAVARAQSILDDMPESTNFRGERSTWAYNSAKESIENLGTIEVNDATLVGSTYTFPSRVEYPEFSTYDPDDWTSGDGRSDEKIAARMNAAMTTYREVLGNIPGAIVTEASGARKINWDVVPEGLKSNYQSAVKWANENGYVA